MLNGKELNKKYNGKEVICKTHKNAHICELTSYCIKIEAADGHWIYDTGTGPYDNAVANGYIEFADEVLQEEFIEDYEQYVYSEEGRTEAWLYYAQMYD